MNSVVRFVAVALGLLLTLCLTLVIFGLPLGPSLSRIATGAFGSEAGIARSLVRMTPLLLAGLGMVLAWRAGMYNIGGEGQFIVGGLTGATLYKLAPGLPPALLGISILVVSAVGGALYAALAGWLQISRGVQVVISTILLNFIALHLLDYCVNGPLREQAGQNPLTDRLPDLAMLAKFSVRTDLHAGIFLAIITALLVFGFLFFTSPGFKIRLVGENQRAARANGISPERVQILAMALSGALCGLAGGVEYTALAGQLGRSFSENWGFLAIPVALLGGLHPLGLIPSSLYFGALLAGTDYLSRFSVGGKSIIYLIQGAAVLVFMGLQRWFDQKQPVVLDEEART